MLLRLSAALIALYLIHGSGNLAGDGARLAADLGMQVPQAAVAFCAEKPDLCREALVQAAHLVKDDVLSSNAAQVPALDARPTTSAYPLPPRRPLVGSPKKA